MPGGPRTLPKIGIDASPRFVIPAVCPVHNRGPAGTVLDVSMRTVFGVNFV